jgi:hypothetical protein
MDVSVTSQGISKAYDVALAQFVSRTGVVRRPDVERVFAQPLSPSLLARIALLEQLAWAEALMLQGQRPLALRIIAEAWIKNPLSSLPPRFLFRNILPASMVRALVIAKARVDGSA